MSIARTRSWSSTYELSGSQVESFDFRGWTSASEAKPTLVSVIADATPHSGREVGRNAKVQLVDGRASDLAKIVERRTLSGADGLRQAVAWLNTVRHSVLLEDARPSIRALRHISGLIRDQRRVPHEAKAGDTFASHTSRRSSLNWAVSIRRTCDGLAVSSARYGTEIVARHGAIVALAAVARSDRVGVVGIAEGIGSRVSEGIWARIEKSARRTVTQTAILARFAVLAEVRAMNIWVHEGAGEVH